MPLHRLIAGPWPRRLLVILGVLLLAEEAGRFVTLRLAESRLLRLDAETALADAGMARFATARGKAVYRETCAACHGPDGKGNPRRGAPALDDRDWLYGAGKATEIEQTVTYGIRSHHPKSWNLAAMPAFARAVPLPGQALNPLTPAEIRDLVEFLTELRGGSADPESAARGAQIYEGAGGCRDCHASDGRGDTAIGAPDLGDAVSLYGDGGRDALFDSIAYGLQGVCPTWVNRLSAAQIREVSFYVFALSHSSSPSKADDHGK